MNQIPLEVRNKLLELDNDNRQLQQDKIRLEAQVKCNMDFAAEAEEENERLRQQIESAGGNDKQIRDLQGRVTSLQRLLEERTAELGTCSSRADSLEAELKEAHRQLENNRPVTPEPSMCEDPVVPQDILNELNRLRDERDNAEFAVEEVRNDLLGMQEERNQLNEVLQLANESIESLKNDKQELREQVQSLEAELMDARAVGPGAKKGNSMFGEFVEERVKLEKDLKKLFAENELLRRETILLRRQVDEARIAAATRRAPAAPAVCRCKAVSDELALLRGRVRSSDESSQRAYQRLIDITSKKGTGGDKYADEALKTARFHLQTISQERDCLKAERDGLKDKVWTLEATVANQERVHLQLKDENASLEQLRMMMAKRLDEAETRLTHGGKIPVETEPAAGETAFPFIRSSAAAENTPAAKKAKLSMKGDDSVAETGPTMAHKPPSGATESQGDVGPLHSTNTKLPKMQRLLLMQKERDAAKKAKEEEQDRLANESRQRQSLIGGLGAGKATPLRLRANEPAGLLHRLPDYMKSISRPAAVASSAKKHKIMPGKLNAEKMLGQLRPLSPILGSGREEAGQGATASPAYERIHQQQEEEQENEEQATRDEFDYEFNLDQSPFEGSRNTTSAASDL